MASSRKRPLWKTSVGRDLTRASNRSDRTESQVTSACNATSAATAAIPLAMGVPDKTVEATSEPTATVTTKSNAFIFDSVRLPPRRRTTRSSG